MRALVKRRQQRPSAGILGDRSPQLSQEAEPKLEASSRLRRLLRGVAVLSASAALMQGLSLAAQVSFAIWLDPEDFGAWATAVSATIILTGLLNFGEVNLYLTQRTKGLRASLSRSLRLNCLLFIPGTAIALAYAIAGRGSVAMLILISVLNLPLLGCVNVLFAGALKNDKTRSVAFAQVVAGILRALVGLAVAYYTHSASAFAVSMIAYSLIVILLLLPKSRYWESAKEECPERVSLGERMPWAAQSVVQLVPTQVDTFVASMLASPATVGIYFISFQCTAGIAALISSTLYRSAVAELSSAGDALRPVLFGRIAHSTILLVTSMIAVGYMLLAPAEVLMPNEWHAAAVTLMILLASLPSRFLITLADSYLSASGRSWRSVWLNLADVAGTGIAALSAMNDDPALIALCLVAWKAVLSTVCLGLVNRGRLSLLTFYAGSVSLLAAVLLPIGAVTAGPTKFFMGAFVLMVCLSLALLAFMPQVFGLVRVAKKARV
ncbi:lipopolysaccharide biosynthesis protein [Jidongwangia harbinensis]|uniref:lipopolysaccharide biosynthesis protein n=1 Tax=Jidongwangia harbinensis TaxID=2878561 RepID=UPI001CDA4780|nr:oligosaccharide flippase family protein [Jidongwangia harbinensis]MCA2213271.1 oligosaccharide flippase family protein [Jidongwangia harbinensis]